MNRHLGRAAMIAIFEALVFVLAWIVVQHLVNVNERQADERPANQRSGTAR